MALDAIVIEDEGGVDAIRAQWDGLAVETGRPFCAPGWMMAWWRHARPEGSGLRVVAVSDGDRLVGVAPLWARRGGRRSAYEALTSRLSPPAGPLATPGREREVAGAMAEALVEAGKGPSSIRLWDGTGADRVSGHIGPAWPGRPAWSHAAPEVPVPVVSLRGLDYDSWFATRSSKFRQESRRLRRRLEDEGARFLLAGPAEVEGAIGAFIELHRSRWRERGGSDALVDGLRAMLVEAATELLPSGRLRVFTIEVEGRTIAANVLVAAGGEVSGWNSGFDERWGRFSPSMQLTLHALADATRRGEERMSLGPGDTGYKRRLADTQEEMSILTLAPHGVSYPATRLRLIPYQVRWSLSRRLSERTKQRLRRLSRR